MKALDGYTMIDGSYKYDKSKDLNPGSPFLSPTSETGSAQIFGGIDFTPIGAEKRYWNEQDIFSGEIESNRAKCERHYKAGCCAGTISMARMTVIGIINALQIMIFNLVYSPLAEKLVDCEAHRTQNKYDNSLIAKNFIFKAVNAFTSFFYIAFFAQVIDKTPKADVLLQLRVQLASLFLTMIIVNNAFEVLLPKLGPCFEKCGQNNETCVNKGWCNAPGDLSPAEEECKKPPYENTMEDMAEMAIQFGYVSLFCMAFPLSPLLALINNVIEIKVDLSNLVYDHQRPIPRGATGLGVWVNIFEQWTTFAVVVNIGLYSFCTNDAMQNFKSEIGCFAFFGGLSIVLLLVVTGLRAAIDDEKQSIKDHLERQRLIEEVIAKGAVPDDDEVTDDDDVHLMNASGDETKRKAKDNYLLHVSNVDKRALFIDNLEMPDGVALTTYKAVKQEIDLGIIQALELRGAKVKDGAQNETATAGAVELVPQLD